MRVSGWRVGFGVENVVQLLMRQSDFLLLLH
jgi:hypothetical protein